MANTTIYINTPPSQLWSILTDFESWIAWNTMCKDMKRLNPSSHPALNTALSFTPTIEGIPAMSCSVWLTLYDAEKEMAWKGGPLPRFMGPLSQGHHWFRLKPDGTGTLFEHGEDVEGLMKYLVTKGMSATLENALTACNQSSKKYAESQTSS